MAAIPLATLAQQAQTDIPIIQAALATRQTALDAARLDAVSQEAAIGALMLQLRERQHIIFTAQCVIGTATLDPIVP